MRGVRRLAGIVGVQLPLVLPEDPASFPRGNEHSPQLRFGTWDHELTALMADYMRHHRTGRFLDAGGGTGNGSRHLAGRFEHVVLDIESDAPGAIIADMCDCPQVPDASFDIVYSVSTFEHLPRPWRGAAELARILKPDGLALVCTCFSWRFHPVPGDYFRFSHMALEQIFADAGLETVTSGYDLRQRRHDMRGGKLAGNTDAAPADDLGGFRENWAVYYAGRKPSS
jgi:SAM-dependent methyltransferase